jgi:hypothetical protein
MSETNPELDALYEELVGLCRKSLAWATKNGYPEVESYPHYRRAREIGEILNAQYGFPAMQAAVHLVYQKVRSKDGGQAALLEYGWSGIGRWQS